MKDKDYLRMHQLEETLGPFRPLAEVHPPRRGWIRAIQDALGISNRQLAKRLRVVHQSIEDMQEDEARGAIKLQTLRKLAKELDCRVVYAVVPNKPLQEIRKEQAVRVAIRQLKRVAHSMNLEDQGISEVEQKAELERLIHKLLVGSQRKLWE